jgi:hypothetical protein
MKFFLMDWLGLSAGLRHISDGPCDGTYYLGEWHYLGKPNDKHAKTQQRNARQQVSEELSSSKNCINVFGDIHFANNLHCH